MLVPGSHMDSAQKTGLYLRSSRSVLLQDMANHVIMILRFSRQAATIGSSGKLGSGTIGNLMNQELSPSEQKQQFALLQRINRDHLSRVKRDDQIASTIDAFDLAYRMRQVVPEIMDLNQEPKSIHTLYGVDHQNKNLDKFARQCLMARRFAEAGIRYIQVSTGNVWGPAR